MYKTYEADIKLIRESAIQLDDLVIENYPDARKILILDRVAEMVD